MNGREQAGRSNEAEQAKQKRLQEEILRAVKDVRYGSVEITIHDSEVVQVERREKIRFQKNAG
jgi:hypothetical protein